MNNILYINGRFLTQPVSGVQKFAWGLCSALSDLGVEIRLLVPRNIQHVPEFGTLISVGKLTRHKWEQIELPLYLQKQKIETCLHLCNTAPLVRKGDILTLHDVAFHRNPQWFSTSFARWYNFLIPKILNNASKVLTVSEFSKSEITKSFTLSTNKIEVISNGIFWNSGQELKELPQLENYILTVGSLDPRKGLPSLINAFESLNEPHLKLVVVGRESKVFNTSSLVSSERIVFLDQVNDDQLQALYRHADLFVSSSMYEGFGIPPLEALSLGCKVLLNDIPVYQEIYGSSVHYYDGTVKDLAVKLARRNTIHPTKESVDELISKYSFHNAAERLLELLALF